MLVNLEQMTEMCSEMKNKAKKGDATINSRKNKEFLEKKLYFTTDSAVNNIYIVTIM